MEDRNLDESKNRRDKVDKIADKIDEATKAFIPIPVSIFIIFIMIIISYALIYHSFSLFTNQS